jgi:plasmid stabilization system protein ParE
MANVFRSRQAEQDLLLISEYIAQDSPSAALHWLDGIEGKLTLLAEQPLIGEAISHIRTGLRRSIFLSSTSPRRMGFGWFECFTALGKLKIY